MEETIPSADFDDINAFHTVKKDFKTVYIRMFKCFLLYYKRKCRENGGSLSEGDVLNITIAQFKSYAGSGEYVNDSKAWLEAYAANEVVATVNADVVGHIYAQMPVRTTAVHGNWLQYKSNLKENYSSHGFDIEKRHKNVINDNTFVAERITGEDFSMKKGASKYVMEHDLEESTPGVDYESLNICPPHGEYDAYQIVIDYSNVLIIDIDMICHLDDNNGVRKPPDKIHERTKPKQDCNERLIAGKHGAHKSIGIGNNSDPQSDIAFMTFDMHRFVGDTYDDDNGDDDEDDDNRIDGNDIDDDVATRDEEEEEEEKEEEEEGDGTKIDEICSTRSASSHQIVVNGAPVLTVRVVVLLETFVPNSTKME
jgi:hypothetical protein